MDLEKVARHFAVALAALFGALWLMLVVWVLVPEPPPPAAPMIGGVWGSRRVFFLTGPFAEVVFRADGTGESLNHALPLGPRFSYRIMKDKLYIKVTGQSEKSFPIRSLTHKHLHIDSGGEVLALERFTGPEQRAALANAERRLHVLSSVR